MNKQAFMQELENRLRHLTDEDKYDALEYYSEYIDDLNLPPEADVCAHLGTPKEVARQIIAQTTERKIEEQEEKKSTKGFGSVVWLAILGLFASPIALPLAIAAVVIFLAVLIVIGSVVFAFGVSGVACTVSGLLVAIASVTASELAIKLISAGAGLFVCGLGILFILLTIMLAKFFVRIISGMIKKAASKHAKKNN